MVLWFTILIAMLLVACFHKNKGTRVYAAVLASTFIIATGSLAYIDHTMGPGTHPDPYNPHSGA